MSNKWRGTLLSRRPISSIRINFRTEKRTKFADLLFLRALERDCGRGVARLGFKYFSLNMVFYQKYIKYELNKNVKLFGPNLSTYMKEICLQIYYFFKSKLI